MPENKDEGAYLMRIAILVLIAGLGLAACETVKGAGRDIQNAGQALDQAI